MAGRRPVWLGPVTAGWDHTRVHLSVLADCRTDAYHLAVYLGLAARADIRTGLVKVAEEQLAHAAGCSVRTVRAALVDLERWTYVLVERLPGRRSRYFLLEPPAPQLVSTLFHNPGASCRGDCDPGASCRGKAPTPAPPAGVTPQTPAPPAGVGGPLKEDQSTTTDQQPEAALPLDFGGGVAMARRALRGGDAL